MSVWQGEGGWGGAVGRAVRKYVFKCVSPSRIWQVICMPLEKNGNDLLFKEVAGKVQVKRKTRLVKSKNMAHRSSREF